MNVVFSDLGSLGFREANLLGGQFTLQHPDVGLEFAVSVLEELQLLSPSHRLGLERVVGQVLVERLLLESLLDLQDFVEVAAVLVSSVGELPPGDGGRTAKISKLLAGRQSHHKLFGTSLGIDLIFGRPLDVMLDLFLFNLDLAQI